MSSPSDAVPENPVLQNLKLKKIKAKDGEFGGFGAFYTDQDSDLVFDMLGIMPYNATPRDVRPLKERQAAPENAKWQMRPTVALYSGDRGSSEEALSQQHRQFFIELQKKVAQLIAEKSSQYFSDGETRTWEDIQKNCMEPIMSVPTDGNSATHTAIQPMVSIKNMNPDVKTDASTWVVNTDHVTLLDENNKKIPQSRCFDAFQQGTFGVFKFRLNGVTMTSGPKFYVKLSLKGVQVLCNKPQSSSNSLASQLFKSIVQQQKKEDEEIETHMMNVDIPHDDNSAADPDHSPTTGDKRKAVHFEDKNQSNNETKNETSAPAFKRGKTTMATNTTTDTQEDTESDDSGDESETKTASEDESEQE